MSNGSPVLWEQFLGIDNVWVADTHKEGPNGPLTVGLVGGMHGNERAGIEIVKRRGEISLDCGRLIVIAGNPEAIEPGVRTTNEENINRLLKPTKHDGKFPTREKNESDTAFRARQIKYVLRFCNVVLDQHEHHQPEGGSFFITEEPGFEMAETIGAEKIVAGFSKTEAGSVDAYMHSLGKIGLCIELGYFVNEQANFDLAKEINARFLSACGLVQEKYDPLFDNPSYIRAVRAYTRKKRFEFERHFQPFEELAIGEPIATNGKELIVAKKKQNVIIFPDPSAAVGTEAFNLGHVFKPKSERKA